MKKHSLLTSLSSHRLLVARCKQSEIIKILDVFSFLLSVAVRLAGKSWRKELLTEIFKPTKETQKNSKRAHHHRPMPMMFTAKKYLLIFFCASSSPSPRLSLHEQIYTQLKADRERERNELKCDAYHFQSLKLHQLTHLTQHNTTRRASSPAAKTFAACWVSP